MGLDYRNFVDRGFGAEAVMDVEESIFALGLLAVFVWLLWFFRGKSAGSQSFDSFSPDLSSESSDATTPELSFQGSQKLLALPWEIFGPNIDPKTGKFDGSYTKPEVGEYIKMNGNYFLVDHLDSKGNAVFVLVDSSLFQN